MKEKRKSQKSQNKKKEKRAIMQSPITLTTLSCTQLNDGSGHPSPRGPRAFRLRALNRGFSEKAGVSEGG